jgi:hypothetical protein
MLPNTVTDRQDVLIAEFSADYEAVRIHFVSEKIPKAQRQKYFYCLLPFIVTRMLINASLLKKQAKKLYKKNSQNVLSIM